MVWRDPEIQTVFSLFFMTSFPQTVYNIDGDTNGEKLFGKDLEGSVCDLVEIGIVGVPAEIQSRHFPNKSL
jgi:hypothetical protein